MFGGSHTTAPSRTPGVEQRYSLCVYNHCILELTILPERRGRAVREPVEARSDQAAIVIDYSPNLSGRVLAVLASGVGDSAHLPVQLGE